MNFEVPFLTHSRIGEIAASFLNQYHSSFEIPVPVEKIVDVQMGIHIFPFPRLYKDWNQNGFLSRDRTTIYVDEQQYDQFHEKCRFTIAHELGHYLLHKDCYDAMGWETADEFIHWRLSVDKEKIGWFDTHADWFAGQILVPTAKLEESCRAVVERHKDKLSALTSVPDDFWSYAANEIALDFEVNPPVVEIRIKKEKLNEKIPVI